MNKSTNNTSFKKRNQRRHFLKTSSASLAAMTLSSPALLNPGAAPKKIRIGVVGGGFGCSFQWHEHPDCIVEAVSDLRPERRDRLVKTYNCKKTYNSLEELEIGRASCRERVFVCV